MSKISENLRMQDEHGYTKLHTEVIIFTVWGSLNPTKTLANIAHLIEQDPGLLDIRDKKGLTPLCHAKKASGLHSGHTELLKLIAIKSDAEVSIVEEPASIQSEAVAISNDPMNEAIPTQSANEDKPADEAPQAQSPSKSENPIPLKVVAKPMINIIGKGVTSLDDLKELKDSFVEMVKEFKEERIEEATYIYNSLVEGRKSVELYKLILDGASPEAITECIKAGQVDVNGRTFGFNTPLHLAVKSGNLEAAKCLLTHGADKTLKNFMGKTPLEKAIKAGNPEMINCLSDNADDTAALDSDVPQNPQDTGYTDDYSDALVDPINGTQGD